MNDNGFMDMIEDKPHYVALELRTKAWVWWSKFYWLNALVDGN